MTSLPITVTLQTISTTSLPDGVFPKDYAVSPPAMSALAHRQMLLRGDGTLSNQIWASSVFFCILISWFGWMQYQGRHASRDIVDTCVNFELQCPAPEAGYRVPVAQTAASPAVRIVHPTPIATPVSRLAPVTVPVSMVPDTASVQTTAVPDPPVAGQPLELTARANPAPVPVTEPILAPVPESPVKGDLKSLDGANFGGMEAQALPTAAPVDVAAKGNIRPYTIDVKNRIGDVWHPTESFGTIQVSLTIGKSGRILAHQIVTGSGSEDVDLSLSHVLDSIELAPFPAWYRGEQLKVRLNLRDANTPAS